MEDIELQNQNFCNKFISLLEKTRPRSVTIIENVMMMLMYYNLKKLPQYQASSDIEVATYIASLVNRSADTVKTVVREWKDKFEKEPASAPSAPGSANHEDQKVVAENKEAKSTNFQVPMLPSSSSKPSTGRTPRPSARTKTKPTFPEEYKGVKLDDFINFVNDRQKDGRTTQSTDFIELCKQKYNKIFTIPQIKEIINKFGFQYSRGTRKYFFESDKKVQEKRKDRKRKFILDMVEAIEEEKDNSVIVYFDESYVHKNHCRLYGWFHPIHGNGVHAGLSKGPRLIIMHAMTKDGWLTGYDQENKPILVDEYAEGPQLTCNMIYRGKEKGEYHQNVNAQVFLGWVSNRLIPTFKSVYGDKKMILVLDNARYHLTKPEGYKDVSSMSKKELCKILKEKNITKVGPVNRKGVEFILMLKKVVLIMLLLDPV